MVQARISDGWSRTFFFNAASCLAKGLNSFGQYSTIDRPEISGQSQNKNEKVQPGSRLHLILCTRFAEIVRKINRA
jgi:hypothetical protein